MYESRVLLVVLTMELSVVVLLIVPLFSVAEPASIVEVQIQCIFSRDKISKGIIFLLVFHILLVLTVVSYTRTTFSNPGFVTKVLSTMLFLFDNLAKEDEEKSPVRAEGSDSSEKYPFCAKCNVYKPDRGSLFVFIVL